MLTPNENTTDRIIRGIIGVALLLGAFLALAGVWQWVVALIGVVLLVTSITGVCLAYKLFGINTRGETEKAG
jgi:phosphate/sulfate permease